MGPIETIDFVSQHLSESKQRERLLIKWSESVLLIADMTAQLFQESKEALTMIAGFGVSIFSFMAPLIIPEFSNSPAEVQGMRMIFAMLIFLTPEIETSLRKDTEANNHDSPD